MTRPYQSFFVVGDTAICTQKISSLHVFDSRLVVGMDNGDRIDLQSEGATGAQIQQRLFDFMVKDAS